MPITKIDRIMTYGLVAIIALAALLQGAVDAWSLAVLELALLVLTIIWMVKSFAEKKLIIKVPATLYPLTALLIFAIIQSTTWTGENGEIKSLSLDPEATSAVSIALMFLIFGHLIAANFLGERENFKSAASFLTFFGFALAVFGILQHFTWNGNFFWMFPTEQVDSGGVRGSFVNHNHFAGFMELLIPLPVALLLNGAVGNKKLLYGFAAAMMTLALVLSLSRGGIISIACGAAVTLACSLIYQHRTKSATVGATSENGAQLKQTLTVLAAGILLIGSVTLGTFWLGIDPVVDRVSNNEVLSSEESATTFRDSRGWIWENTINIFWANSLTGTGLGSFETVYPNYSATDELLIVDRAHNDYLQILSDAGIVGGILCLWFLAAVIYSAVCALRTTDRQRAAFAIGSIGGVIAMAVHSTFDFNLQIPSNALLFLTLTGALAGLSSSALVQSKTEINETVNAEPDTELYAYGVSP